MSPQVLMKKTSPPLPPSPPFSREGSGEIKNEEFGFQPHDASVAEVEGELPSFLDPSFTQGKNQHPVLEPGSPALFRAGRGSASPSAPALHPPIPPRHLLAQAAGLSLQEKTGREVLLFALRSLSSFM